MTPSDPNNPDHTEPVNGACPPEPAPPPEAPPAEPREAEGAGGSPTPPEAETPGGGQTFPLALPFKQPSFDELRATVGFPPRGPLTPTKHSGGGGLSLGGDAAAITFPDPLPITEYAALGAGP